VELSDGAHVKFDEDYIRESILSPSAKIVKGYQPIMPTFQGLVTEENLLQLIEYIKTLTAKESRPPAGATAAASRRKSAKE
jgi:cytochrome c oxidase subunit 2